MNLKNVFIIQMQCYPTENNMERSKDFSFSWIRLQYMVLFFPLGVWKELIILALERMNFKICVYWWPTDNTYTYKKLWLKYFLWLFGNYSSSRFLTPATKLTGSFCCCCSGATGWQKEFCLFRRKKKLANFQKFQ